MVAFDIDGCVNDIKQDIIRIGKDYFPSYDVSFHQEGYYLREIWEGASEDCYNDFWNKFGYEIYTNPPQKNFFEVIQYLRKHHISACYITTRDVKKRFNSITFDKITEMWLKKYDLELPIYYWKDKDYIARELGVKLMVEDKPANIIKLQKVTKVLIYNHSYNADMDGIHISDWIEVLQYL